ncbi:hypothetical protein EZS27_027071 [termite gut metagenome]|uniref:Integrase catalytic domain-containing protein n=1 Tax=termite gut metagenome TaxID=433724 RepID=A0A5J4QSF4_9ZZZZ
MYQVYNNTVAITVEDWCKAGLSYHQFNHDSKEGYLTICRRGYRNNTLIDVCSIKRPDRLQKLESVYGKIAEKPSVLSLFEVNIDTEARAFFLEKRRPDGTPLDKDLIEKYVNRASLFNGVKKALEKSRNTRAAAGRKSGPNMANFWGAAVAWYTEQSQTYPCIPINHSRAFERAFKRYLNEGYSSIINGAVGNDAARKVSDRMERLLLALWRTNDKPFVNRVHELYLEFTCGSRELVDKTTGEIFSPEDFRYKDRTPEISVSTVWGYLKDVVNNTSVYSDRNGNFDYTNSKRPKHHRHVGQYSLSKVSMDDVALSRKSVRGWVYKYIAIDVVSGYYFRPAYIVGKPTHATVYEAFRNMFCELISLGLPMPGELEVEHHLMKDIEWLNKAFPFVHFCASPTEKRAEHGIRSLKYSTAKDAGHTRGRWFARGEAYKCVRNKVDGDFVEPLYQPQTIIADDLLDIDHYNNELHPLQKTYPGMTRKQVFLSKVNPSLKPIQPWYLCQFIGNQTQTSLHNNDYCRVDNEKFELSDFEALKRLKSNNTEVTAYWLPLEDGSVDKVYLYQEDTYIGEALNRSAFDYNECAIERTPEDEAKMLHQQKRVAKFDKLIKESKTDIPKVMHRKKDAAEEEILSAPLETFAPVILEEEDEEEKLLKEYAGIDMRAHAEALV